MKTNEHIETTNPDEMTLFERVQAPTPKFFRILRTVGLSLVAVSGTILAAPIALPAGIVTAAGYIALGAGVLSAVSQTTVQTPPTESVRQAKPKNKMKDETP